MFHPDLLADTPLQGMMSQYTCFSYNTNEALFPSEREKRLIMDVFGKIDEELHTGNPDLLIVTDYIKLVLDYCLHAYDRQFHALPSANSDILARFEQLCHDYYEKKNSPLPKDCSPCNIVLTVSASPSTISATLSARPQAFPHKSTSNAIHFQRQRNCCWPPLSASTR